MRVQLGRLLWRMRTRGMRGSAMNERPSLRHGLPFGWWRDPDFWGTFATIVIFALLGLVLLAAWFLDLKAWW